MMGKWTNDLPVQAYISRDPILFSNPNVSLHKSHAKLLNRWSCVQHEADPNLSDSFFGDSVGLTIRICVAFFWSSRADLLRSGGLSVIVCSGGGDNGSSKRTSFDLCHEYSRWRGGTYKAGMDMRMKLGMRVVRCGPFVFWQRVLSEFVRFLGQNVRVRFFFVSEIDTLGLNEGGQKQLSFITDNNRIAFLKSSRTVFIATFFNTL